MTTSAKDQPAHGGAAIFESYGLDVKVETLSLELAMTLVFGFPPLCAKLKVKPQTCKASLANRCPARTELNLTGGHFVFPTEVQRGCDQSQGPADRGGKPRYSHQGPHVGTVRAGSHCHSQLHEHRPPVLVSENVSEFYNAMHLVD